MMVADAYLPAPGIPLSSGSFPLQSPKQFFFPQFPPQVLFKKFLHECFSAFPTSPDFRPHPKVGFQPFAAPSRDPAFSDAPGGLARLWSTLLKQAVFPGAGENGGKATYVCVRVRVRGEVSPDSPFSHFLYPLWKLPAPMGFRRVSQSHQRWQSPWRRQQMAKKMGWEEPHPVWLFRCLLSASGTLSSQMTLRRNQPHSGWLS